MLIFTTFRGCLLIFQQLALFFITINTQKSVVVVYRRHHPYSGGALQCHKLKCYIYRMSITKSFSKQVFSISHCSSLCMFISSMHLAIIRPNAVHVFQYAN